MRNSNLLVGLDTKGVEKRLRNHKQQTSSFPWGRFVAAWLVLACATLLTRAGKVAAWDLGGEYQPLILHDRALLQACDAGAACNMCLEAVSSSQCPADINAAYPNCTSVPVGALCEASGECGTDNNLNNCGAFDVYRLISRTPTQAPTDHFTTRSPTFTPTTLQSTCDAGAECFVCLHAVNPSLCPSRVNSLTSCEDATTVGEFCEGSGECGTDNNLNNCDAYDVYLIRDRVVTAAPTYATAPPTTSPPTSFPTTKYTKGPTLPPVCDAGEECFMCLQAVNASVCPSQPNDLMSCEDATVVGELCEGSGGCGTDNNLNNCDAYDVYFIRDRVVTAAPTRVTSPPTTSPPTTSPTTKYTRTPTLSPVCDAGEECFMCLQVVNASACPVGLENLANCGDSTLVGAYCEGSGGCGTSNSLNNCDLYDVYFLFSRVITSPPTSYPTTSPTEFPTLSPSSYSPTVSPTRPPSTLYTFGPTSSPTGTSAPTFSCDTGEECFMCLQEVVPVDCPSHNLKELPKCQDVVNQVGALCDGVDVCGASNNLDNCGLYDVYRLMAMLPTEAPSLSPTTRSPTTTPTTSPSTASPTRFPTSSPTTSSPSTRSPTTSSPTTLSPTTTIPTFSPTTLSPSTVSPTTDSPTRSPTTLSPSTISPTTTSPTTLSPTTMIPTLSPTTLSPTTVSPTTDSPTRSPTTSSPSTISPTTSSPTTNSPSTTTPTTSPTTLSPTTVSPTTRSPTSSPTTSSPTSRSPTSESPTSMSPSSSQPTTSPTTIGPSTMPTASPTRAPTTHVPTVNLETFSPTGSPTYSPTSAPTTSPSTFTPTTTNPTSSPSSRFPTTSPTTSPSDSPTTASPSSNPTSLGPTASPTTISPSSSPSPSPSSSSPTTSPTPEPASSAPTDTPRTFAPSEAPTITPTTNPTTAIIPTSSSPTTSAPTMVPSQIPSFESTASPTLELPTDVPTNGEPILTPTGSPTTPPTAGDDSSDDEGDSIPSWLAPPYLRLVAGSPALPVPFPSGTSTHQLESRLSRSFVGLGLGPPSVLGQVQVGMDGDRCDGAAVVPGKGMQGGEVFALARSPAAEVRAVVRTRTLYHDSHEISVHYHVTDAVGQPQVLATGITVMLLILNPAMPPSTFQVMGTCGNPDAVTGAGDCYFDGAALVDWFDKEKAGIIHAKVQVAYEGEVVTESLAEDIELAQRVDIGSLVSAGMLTVLPSGPRFRGERIEVLTLAHTGGQALTTFGVRIIYDVSTLSFVRLWVNMIYNAPLVNSEVDAGRVIVSVLGTPENTSLAQVTSDNLHVMTSVFQILDDAPAGARTQVMTVKVDAMVNEQTRTFLSNAAAVMISQLDAPASEGHLQVAVPELRGAYSYLDNAELFNTAPITGDNITATAFSVGVWSFPRDSSSNTRLVPSSCTLKGNTSADTVAATGFDSQGSCIVTLSSANTAGHKRLDLHFAAELHEWSTPIRVWFPKQMELAVEDHTLHAVQGVRSARCSTNRYQKTSLQLTTVFGGEGLEDSPPMDATCLAAFVSNKPSVADVNGVTVSGVNTGSVNVSLAAMPSIFANINVTAAEVQVEALEGWFASAVEWAGVPNSVECLAAFTVNASLLSSLHAEGDRGAVAFVARFSDGHREGVQISDGLEVLVTTGFEQSLLVHHDSATGTIYGLVPVGGESASGPLVTGVWRDACAGGVVARGSAHVQVTLADPVSVEVQSSVNRISHEDDPAAVLGVTTKAYLNVSLTFSDGTSRDMTNDSRTVYKVTAGADVARLDDVAIPGQSTSGVSAFPKVNGTVEVTVTFPDYPAASHLQGSVVISVVRLETLTLSTRPFPFSQSAHSNKTRTLRALPCVPDTYQRVEVQVTATLSDDERYAVTNAITFAASDPNIVRVQTNADNVVHGVAPGSATLSATWAAGSSIVESEGLVLTVSEEEVRVEEVRFTTQWDGLEADTFADFVGTTRIMGVSVLFEDGTLFEDAAGGVQASWMPTDLYLQFDSDQPSKIALAPQGTASLNANHHAAVRLTVSARACAARNLESGTGAASWSHTSEVFANLEPSLGDVDLGFRYGLQLAPMTPGATQTLAVRVNAETAFLTSFLIDARIDPGLLKAVPGTCAAGTSWAGYLFDCTMADPTSPDSVVIVGAQASSTAQGSALTIASFTIQATNVIPVPDLQASVTVYIDTLRFGDTKVVEQESVAAAGSVAVQDARRKLLAWEETIPTSPLKSSMARPHAFKPAARWSRQLLQADILGDTNADGRFDPDDVLRVQQFLVEEPGFRDLSALSPFQRSQLDPTLDYLRVTYDDRLCRPAGQGAPCPTFDDAQYLLRALSGKYRFLAVTSARAVASSPSHSAAELALAVRVLDAHGEPADSNLDVLMELSTKLNNAVTVTMGAMPVLTTSGIEIEAASMGSGRYQVVAKPTSGEWVAEEDVGVVIILKTHGDSSEASRRRYAFFGSSLEGFDPFTELDIPGPPISGTPPTAAPSAHRTPTTAPTIYTTTGPVAYTTSNPTSSPTGVPDTQAPTPPEDLPETNFPTSSASLYPTSSPATAPSLIPSTSPSNSPSSRGPTAVSRSLVPTSSPTSAPTASPTASETQSPTTPRCIGTTTGGTRVQAVTVSQCRERCEEDDACKGLTWGEEAEREMADRRRRRSLLFQSMDLGTCYLLQYYPLTTANQDPAQAASSTPSSSSVPAPSSPLVPPPPISLPNRYDNYNDRRRHLLQPSGFTSLYCYAKVPPPPMPQTPPSRPRTPSPTMPFSSTVNYRAVFTDLNMNDFSPQRMSEFIAEYKAVTAAVARVSTSAITVISITPGSMVVETVVEFQDQSSSNQFLEWLAGPLQGYQDLEAVYGPILIQTSYSPTEEFNADVSTFPTASPTAWPTSGPSPPFTNSPTTQVPTRFSETFAPSILSTYAPSQAFTDQTPTSTPTNQTASSSPTNVPTSTPTASPTTPTCIGTTTGGTRLQSVTVDQCRIQCDSNATWKGFSWGQEDQVDSSGGRRRLLFHDTDVGTCFLLPYTPRTTSNVDVLLPPPPYPLPPSPPSPSLPPPSPPYPLMPSPSPPPALPITIPPKPSQPQTASTSLPVPAPPEPSVPSPPFQPNGSSPAPEGVPSALQPPAPPPLTPPQPVLSVPLAPLISPPSPSPSLPSLLQPGSLQQPLPPPVLEDSYNYTRFTSLYCYAKEFSYSPTSTISSFGTVVNYTAAFTELNLEELSTDQLSELVRDYINVTSTTAGVLPSAITIVSILPGSTAIATSVEFQDAVQGGVFFSILAIPSVVYQSLEDKYGVVVIQMPVIAGTSSPTSTNTTASPSVTTTPTYSGPPAPLDALTVFLAAQAEYNERLAQSGIALTADTQLTADSTVCYQLPYLNDNDPVVEVLGQFEVGLAEMARVPVGNIRLESMRISPDFELCIVVQGIANAAEYVNLVGDATRFVVLNNMFATNFTGLVVSSIALGPSTGHTDAADISTSKGSVDMPLTSWIAVGCALGALTICFLYALHKGMLVDVLSDPTRQLRQAGLDKEMEREKASGVKTGFHWDKNPLIGATKDWGNPLFQNKRWHRFLQLGRETDTLKPETPNAVEPLEEDAPMSAGDTSIDIPVVDPPASEAAPCECPAECPLPPADDLKPADSPETVVDLKEARQKLRPATPTSQARSSSPTSNPPPSPAPSMKLKEARQKLRRTTAEFTENGSIVVGRKGQAGEDDTSNEIHKNPLYVARSARNAASLEPEDSQQAALMSSTTPYATEANEDGKNMDPSKATPGSQDLPPLDPSAISPNLMLLTARLRLKSATPPSRSPSPKVTSKETSPVHSDSQTIVSEVTARNPQAGVATDSPQNASHFTPEAAPPSLSLTTSLLGPLRLTPQSSSSSYYTGEVAPQSAGKPDPAEAASAQGSRLARTATSPIFELPTSRLGGERVSLTPSRSFAGVASEAGSDPKRKHAGSSGKSQRQGSTPRRATTPPASTPPPPSNPPPSKFSNPKPDWLPDVQARSVTSAARIRVVSEMPKEGVVWDEETQRYLSPFIRKLGFDRDPNRRDDSWWVTPPAAGSASVARGSPPESTVGGGSPAASTPTNSSLSTPQGTPMQGDHELAEFPKDRSV